MQLLTKDINIEQVLEKLYEKYEKEMNEQERRVLSFAEFEILVKNKIEAYEYVYAIEGEQVLGVIFYDYFIGGRKAYCLIPSFGYFGSEKILSRLFQWIATKNVVEFECEFSIHLYCHDLETINLFSDLQFGKMSSNDVMDITTREKINNKFEIKELSKEEINNDWVQLWDITKKLVDHLKVSPVFYPGIEYTQSNYKSYFLEEDTHVFICRNQYNAPIGMVVTTDEKNMLLTGSNKSACLNEIYVDSYYRNGELAKALLQKVMNYHYEHNIASLWVCHKTANPNARYFYKKYFTPVEVEMTRVIKPL